ncbi:MAG: type II toxin-antitoxin system VapC family toxin [Bryobacteraceae bacterium]
MVAFDTSIFCLALHPDAKPRSNVDRAKERVQYLLETLMAQDERIVIPTPAFSEFLILAALDAPAYVSKIRENSVFRIELFDERAAIELADVELTARAKGNKRGSAAGSEWQKVKFDRQIVAVARTNGATRIYSDDQDIASHGSDFGVVVLALKDLPTPPAVQEVLELKDAEDTEGESGKPEPQPTELRGGGSGHPQGEAGTKSNPPVDGTKTGDGKPGEGGDAEKAKAIVINEKKPAGELPAGQEGGPKPVVDAEGVEPSSAESQGAAPGKPKDNPI